MRPTGALHLGNYHGALRNWVELQYQYECYFFVADWHALTTGYEDTRGLPQAIHEVLIDWLAAGLNPGVATLFVQSYVPEHAELHLLLSMITPLGWLERVPTLQGPAGAAQGEGPRDLWLSRLPAAAERRHPALPGRLRAGRRGPGRACGGHARDWRAASTTSTAASPTSSTRPSAPSRNSAAATSRQLPPAAPAVSGAAAIRRRSSARSALVESNERITVADRERLLGYLEGTGGQHPAPSRRCC